MLLVDTDNGAATIFMIYLSSNLTTLFLFILEHLLGTKSTKVKLCDF